MDGRGVLRGKCSAKDCTCGGFGAREGSSSCENCGHCPGKHLFIPKESQVSLSGTLDATPRESEIANISNPMWFIATPWQWLRQVCGALFNVVIFRLFGIGTQSSGTSLVCSLEGCQNLRYTDDNGFTHECCSFSHAMEYQRRKAISKGPVIKGVTHCLLPSCNNIVWPFKNYCGKTHAEEGMSMGLQVALLEGEKCIIPECHRRRYKDGTITHPYCSRSHAEEGKRRGIIPTAEQEEDQCKFEGCTRPKYEEGSIKYDYCSKEHAKRDVSEEKILKSKSDVMTWLEAFTSIEVVDLSENDAARNGGELFKRFQAAYKGLPQDQRKTILAFHGTPEANFSSICSNGFDPKRRNMQAYGPGEYFATTPDISIGYSSGNKMLVCELLLGQADVHHTQNNDDTIVVMKNPDHDLPRFVLKFKLL